MRKSDPCVGRVSIIEEILAKDKRENERGVTIISSFLHFQRICVVNLLFCLDEVGLSLPFLFDEVVIFVSRTR